MKKTVLPLLLLTLTACAPEAKINMKPQLDYLEQKPIKVDVDRIEVIKAYKSNPNPPYMDTSLPMPPTAMVQQWVQDRLIPTGSQNTAVVTIEDASIVEEKLPSTEGVRGIFTIDQSEKYKASVALTVEVKDGDGKTLGYARASTRESRTVAENTTLAQRRKVLMMLMESTLSHLDKELEKNMRSHLRSYVQY